MSQDTVKKVLLLFALLFLFTTLSFGEKTGYSKTGEEKVMKRVGSLIKVRPEYEERYIILHRNTFPGVLDRIRKSNIRNYSIFLLNGILFSYYEYVGQDFDADMKSIADSVTKDWWKLTDPMQEPLPTRKPGEWWAEMDQILCLENSPAIAKGRIGQVAEIISGKEEYIKKILKNYPQDL
ncbi:MAG: L-rhamnose mutarotase, partial [Clostridiales bacterium]